MTPMITEAEAFHRAKSGDEFRYYPDTGPENRAMAREFDEKGDTAIVKGFGVYDTAVSTDYAVGLYATREEAEQHAGIEEKKAPETTFEDDAPKASAKSTGGETLTNDEAQGETDEKPSIFAQKKRKMRGKRS